jgi:hypothetical protein
MESTGVYWKPVWHLLEGHVELVLANAQHVRNMPGRKSDMNDATWLAELMAHGLVRGSFVPPEPIRELRDQTRIRDQDVRALPEVTRYELEIEGDPRAWSAAAGMVTGILPIHPSAHEMWASKPDPGVPASDALVRARAFAAALVEAFTARASGDQHAVIAARRTMRQLAPTLFAAYLERQEHGDS